MNDEDIIEDVSFQTNYSLLIILQGEVAEYPEFEDIPVVETFLRLPEVLNFDWHISFVRMAPEGSILLGNSKTSKLERSMEM